MAYYIVTGAAGFIGSRVTHLLLEQGHQVLGIDNLNDAYDVRLKDFRLSQLQNKDGFTFRKADIADKHELSTALSESTPMDAVINLAARAGVRASLRDPWLFFQTNVTGTLNLLQLCVERKIGKFVLASSSSVYGANAALPTSEDADTSHPLQPYAASKKGAEVLCHAYHSLYGIDVSIFRYFTVYGPAGRPDMVMFRFVQWMLEDRPIILYGDGEQSRGFTFVDDVARGTILGLRSVGYEIFNLGGHEVISLNEILKMLETNSGKTAEIQQHDEHPGDMRTSWADIKKAVSLLNWKPQITFEQGLHEMVDWYLTEREWACLVETTDDLEI
jgi:nucleoside-diphosphate-sugar epimerase